eukprot:403365218
MNTQLYNIRQPASGPIQMHNGQSHHYPGMMGVSGSGIIGQQPVQYPPIQQAPIDYLNLFKQGLRVINRADIVKIQELTNFAKLCHGKFSQLIVDAIIERIFNSQNRLVYIYILDSILKNVQGDYIRFFEERIREIFERTFTQSVSMEEKRALLKMFKTWDLFFSFMVLENISQVCQLHEYENRLLTDEDKMKVVRFKKEFEPKNLPEEVYQNGLFVSGSDTNLLNNLTFGGSFNQGGSIAQGQNYAVGQTFPSSGMGPQTSQYGMMGTQQNQQQHLQMQGSNFNPPVSQQPGLISNDASLSGNQSSLIGSMYQGGDQNATGAVYQSNGTQNVAPQSQPPSKALQILEQLKMHMQTTGASASQTAAHASNHLSNNIGSTSNVNDPRQAPAPQSNIYQAQPVTQYGSNYNIQQQNQPGYAQGYNIQGQNQGYKTQQPSYGGNTNQSQMSGAGNYGMQRGGVGVGSSGMGGNMMNMNSTTQLYNRTHIDDNFTLINNVDHTQFGFLPSILKSYQSFKSNQQLLLGQDSRYAQIGSTKPPSFDQVHSLRELNLMAINEVYEGVKFQCAICGMRFIRNQIFKKHLDMHFTKNNEFRRRGNRAVSRPQFMNDKEFVQPKSQLQNLKSGGQQGNLAQKNLEEMVPYTNRDTSCYICKENFDVTFDDEEETWYFVSAKKIRTNVKDPITGQPKKQVIIVHTDCIKQIEMNRDLQKSLKDTTQSNGEVIQKGNEEHSIHKLLSTLQNQTYQDPTAIKFENVKEEVQTEKLSGIKYEQNDQRIDLEELEKQIRGMQNSKRQFLGVKFQQE